MNTHYARREFLKRAAVAAAALGFSGAFGVSRVHAADDDVQTILNLAATAETFACTHYHRVLTSRLRFTQKQLDYLRSALEQELIHLEFLNANGGESLAEAFYFPNGGFRTVNTFANLTAVAETVFVGAYLAATRRFAELGNSLLAATAAQVAVIEGQHLALVRETANVLPNNVALAEPLYYNVSDAVPTLQPLLDGEDGALGPMEDEPRTFPGAEAIRKLIGRSKQSPAKPFIDPTAFPAQ